MGVECSRGSATNPFIRSINKKHNNFSSHASLSLSVFFATFDQLNFSSISFSMFDIVSLFAAIDASPHFIIDRKKTFSSCFRYRERERKAFHSTDYDLEFHTHSRKIRWSSDHKTEWAIACLHNFATLSTWWTFTHCQFLGKNQPLKSFIAGHNL